MSKNNRNKQLEKEKEIVEVLKNYSSYFDRIEKSIEKKEESAQAKFRKYVLPYFTLLSIFLSIFSLCWSIKIYNLGEEYKNSLNPISLKMDFIAKLKISPSVDSEYFPLESHDRYPITYDKNNGEISEKYLFKFNVDANKIESIKLKSRQDDKFEFDISLSDNSKVEELQAYIQVKDTSGNFDYVKKPLEDKDYWESVDEILCIFDPSFLPPSKPYIGIYCLALIGKNDQVYMTTLLTKWGGKIKEKDVFYKFEGIDLYDEYRWLEIANNNSDIANSKEITRKTYEESLHFLKNIR